MKNKENIYYVYEWYNSETGEVFYVGKGSRVRYKQIDGRNQYFLNYYNKYDCKVRKVKEFLSEEEAYDLEIKTIEKYKDVGQCICNFHEGGLGGASNKNTPEDTAMLKIVSSLINRSHELIGSKGRSVFAPLSVAEERSVTFGCEEYGVMTSDQYYELDRDKKLKVATKIMELLEEEDYNNEVIGLVADGAYFSFDDYWEQQYKY